MQERRAPGAVPGLPADGPPVASLRVMIWYWGTGGAGIRLTDRVAAALASVIGAGNVAVSCHAGNAWRDRLAARGHPVSMVAGAAGQDRRVALALQAAPRLLALRRQLRRHRPDAILIPMNFALAWPLALLPRMMGIPLVYMAHDAEPHSGDFAPRLQRLTQDRLVRAASSLIAPSSHTARRLAQIHPKAPPATVLPLASLLAPRRAEPRPAPDGPVRLLFLGRLIAYKGLTLLAEALGAFRDRKDWTLTIAGAGPEERGVRAAFAGWPQVDLSMLRRLDEEEIEALVDRHDVLVSPYLDASQSGAVPEALAAGMPCLVTPVGGLAEQIGQGRAGWIAAGASVDGLRAAIGQVLADRAGHAPRSAAALTLVGRGAPDLLAAAIDGALRRG